MGAFGLQLVQSGFGLRDRRQLCVPLVSIGFGKRFEVYLLPP